MLCSRLNIKKWSPISGWITIGFTFQRRHACGSAGILLDHRQPTMTTPSSEWAAQSISLLRRIQQSKSLVNPQLSKELDALIKRSAPAEKVFSRAIMTYTSMLGAAGRAFQSSGYNPMSETKYNQACLAARNFLSDKLKGLMTNEEIEKLINIHSG